MANEKKEMNLNDAAQDKTKGKGKSRKTKGAPRKSSNSRDYDRGNSTRKSLDATGRDNDPNWYFLDRALADQASSFSFNSYLGVNDAFPTYSIDGDSLKLDKYSELTVPSIMAINVNPSPGDTSNVQSGINIAGLKTYTTLSSMNAKTTNYAPQDVTTLILAIGEIISSIEYIRRAFGVAFTYNQRNRDLPHRLLKAMGFNPDDFLANLADHRLQFNSLITAMNKVPFLDNIAYLYKCADIYQKLYTDSESQMAQIYFMRPYSTWVLDEAASDKGTVLKTIKPFGLDPEGGPKTFKDVVAQVGNMINMLFTSATFNYIYSDILNYSSKTGAKLLYLDYLAEDYAVIPEYNRNFLLQIHNLNVVGNPDPVPENMKTKGFTPENDVYPNPDTNALTYKPLFKYATSDIDLFTADQLIVDMDTPDATVVDRIEATRFQTALSFDSIGTASGETGYAYFVAKSIPDHYVVSVIIYCNDFYKQPDETGKTVDFIQLYKPYFGQKDFTAPNYVHAICALTQFDWAPIFLVGYSAGNVVPNENPGNEQGISPLIFPFGDLNYYTLVDTNWYRRVNDLAFQALFELR